MKTAKELKLFKRKMANHQTKSELEFESILIKNNIKYKKQVIIGFYILDFILIDKLVCVEIDGLYHNNEEQIFKDKLRTSFIEKCGLSIIRIKNEDVNCFNTNIIKELPDYTEKEFRHVLAMGNAYKGKYIKK